MQKERLHIYPVNDTREHNTSNEWCACTPSVIESEESVLVIHNAHDAREFFEQDHRELEEEFGRLATGMNTAPAPLILGTTT